MQLKVILKKKSCCRKIIIKAFWKIGQIISKTWEREEEGKEGKSKACKRFQLGQREANLVII